ncbi:MAG: hypothetical protein PHE84_10110 [bacterium]|nr:hypothetical protein [bacterium]
MKKIVIFLFALAAFPLLGCSTITATSMIKTIPDEADVYFQEGHVGKTPWKLDNSHGLPDEVVFRFEKEGYVPLNVKLEKEMDYTYGILSIIPVIPGLQILIFWAWDYDDSYTFKLTPKKETAPGN